MLLQKSLENILQVCVSIILAESTAPRTQN
jgi:hypothetical protein